MALETRKTPPPITAEKGSAKPDDRGVVVDSEKNEQAIVAESERVLTKMLDGLKTDPLSLFNTSYFKSFDRDAGVITMHAGNFIFKISSATQEKHGVDATFDSIVKYLQSSDLLSRNNVTIEGSDALFDQVVVKITNATETIDNALKEKKQDMERQFQELMQIVSKRLNEVNGKSYDMGGDYIKSGDRVLLRKWPKEIRDLLDVLKDEDFSTKFSDQMSQSGYMNAKLGFEDDGHPQRNWIELSWEEPASQ